LNKTHLAFSQKDYISKEKIMKGKIRISIHFHMLIAVWCILSCVGQVYGQNWLEKQRVEVGFSSSSGLFGIQVSCSGDYAVVGIPQENSVGGGAGAAYIFFKDEGGIDNWGLVKRIESNDLQAGDQFGGSVSISGDFVVVGAYSEDSNGSNAGAAYIFAKDEGGTDNWGQIKKLIPSNSGIDYRFGASICIDQNQIIVGAALELLDPNFLGTLGAAYIFAKDEGGLDNWGEVARLVDNFGDFTQFGNDVSISGDNIIVGALQEPVGGVTATGAVYLFSRNEGGLDNWGRVRKFISPIPGRFFGVEVSISEDLIVIGESNSSFDSGSAYIYAKDGLASWSEIAKLKASDSEINDRFGFSVAISDDNAIIGALKLNNQPSNPNVAYFFSPSCNIESVTSTIPVCTSGTGSFDVFYQSSGTSPTQTVVAVSDHLGFAEGQILAMGSNSPLTINLPSNTPAGSLMLSLQDFSDSSCSSTFIVDIPDCSSNPVPATVPTLSEWGLILFTLLLLTTGALVLIEPSLSVVGAQSFSLKNLPFDWESYLSAWLWVFGLILLIFSVAIIGFGYEMTGADPMGAILSSLILAYLLTLIKSIKP